MVFVGFIFWIFMLLLTFLHPFFNIDIAAKQQSRVLDYYLYKE